MSNKPRAALRHTAARRHNRPVLVRQLALPIVGLLAAFLAGCRIEGVSSLIQMDAGATDANMPRTDAAIDSGTRSDGGSASLDAGSLQSDASTTVDPEAGLVARIHFDGDRFDAPGQQQPSGTSVQFRDVSGMGNHATCYRSVVLGGTTYPMDQCPRAGVGPNGSAAADMYGDLCDVQSDHLGIARSPSLNELSQGTVALWVLYHRTTPDGGVPYRSSRLLDTFAHNAPGTWYLGRDGTTNNLLRINTLAGLPERVFTFPDANLYDRYPETWNHLAFTWDGTSIRGYYNGQPFADADQTKFGPLRLGTYLTIGALNHSDNRNIRDYNCPNQYRRDAGADEVFVQPNAGFLNGMFDDIRVYSRPLNAAEVAVLADAPNRRPSHTLHVDKGGTGRGFINSSPSGIACGSYCIEAFPPATRINLTAKAAPDSVFAGWAAPCSGDGGCSFNLDAPKRVTAIFQSIAVEVARAEAASATVTAPFKVIDNVVVQVGNVNTTPETGGKLEYDFDLDAPADVLVVVRMSAISAGGDSFFVNIDSPPTDPEMVWDTGQTVGFEDRFVRWRGSGTSERPAIDPKWFTLTAGRHRLIIVGREPGAQIQSFSILRRGP